MDSKTALALRIAGIIGIITPIITFTLIFLAVSTSPQFSWTENALSDLGVQTAVTATLFNFGLIIGGLLAIVFASGLNMYVQKTVLGKFGAFLFALDCLTLVSIGVFPENVRPTHYYVSVAFFVLFPLSMFFVAAGFLRTSKMKLCLFTVSAALVAALIWIIQFAINFVPDVAIPETVAALAASAWSIVLGFKMFKEASQSTK